MDKTDMADPGVFNPAIHLYLVSVKIFFLMWGVGSVCVVRVFWVLCFCCKSFLGKGGIKGEKSPLVYSEGLRPV